MSELEASHEMTYQLQFHQFLIALSLPYLSIIENTYHHRKETKYIYVEIKSHKYYLWQEMEGYRSVRNFP